MADQITWFFNWFGGGYNTVRAYTRTEALKKAIKLGAPYEYAPDKFTIRLAPDPKTLIRDPMQAKTFAEDKRYVGMFD